MAAPLIDPVQSLSESQKNCLRLVAKGMTSKEIALETGLSPQTVDTYLKAAMARLGAGSRREAARRLVQMELSQELGSPPTAIAPAEVPSERGPATDSGGWAKAFYPPPLGGSVNELTGTQRTLAVLKVAVIATAVIVALTLLVAGLLETFR